MTKAELKEIVIDKIYFSDNEKLLEKVNTLLDSEDSKGKVYKLSPEQAEAVRDGLSQIEKGEYYTNEEIEKDNEEWLKE